METNKWLFGFPRRPGWRAAAAATADGRQTDRQTDIRKGRRGFTCSPSHRGPHSQMTFGKEEGAAGGIPYQQTDEMNFMTDSSLSLKCYSFLDPLCIKTWVLVLPNVGIS